MAGIVLEPVPPASTRLAYPFRWGAVIGERRFPARPDYPITVTELLTNMVIRPGGASDPFEAVCCLDGRNVGDGGRETGRGNCSRTLPRL